MKRFVVIGLGNFGSTAAETLFAQRHDVLAVDTSEASVERIAPHVSRAVVADGRNLKVLERIGARGADGGIVSTGDDITASILATMALKDLGVRDIYVKVISTDHARVLDKLGVTETIFPERDSAMRLATRIASSGVIDHVRLGHRFSIQEMAVPEGWIGQSLRALRLPERYGLSVIAVHDMLTDEITVVPNADAPLKDSDTLIVAGADDNLARAAAEE